MPKGRDTSRDPNRRVDNVTHGNFGHPMQNHPAFMASRGILPMKPSSKKKVEGIDEPIDIMKLKDLPSDHPVFQNQPKFPKAAYEVSEQDEVEMAKKRDDAPVHGIPRPPNYTKAKSLKDDAPVHGIPRPKLSKKDMEY